MVSAWSSFWIRRTSQVADVVARRCGRSKQATQRQVSNTRSHGTNGEQNRTSLCLGGTMLSRVPCSTSTRWFSGSRRFSQRAYLLKMSCNTRKPGSNKTECGLREASVTCAGANKIVGPVQRPRCIISTAMPPPNDEPAPIKCHETSSGLQRNARKGNSPMTRSGLKLRMASVCLATQPAITRRATNFTRDLQRIRATARLSRGKR